MGRRALQTVTAHFTLISVHTLLDIAATIKSGKNLDALQTHNACKVFLFKL